MPWAFGWSCWGCKFLVTAMSKYRLLCYYGDHKEEGLKARLGVWIIRRGQAGHDFGKCTHVEGWVAGTPDAATIIGASLRDGGQIRKREGVALNKSHWRVIESPEMSKGISDQIVDYLENQIGRKYGILQAAATVSPFAANIRWLSIGFLGLFAGYKWTPEFLSKAYTNFKNSSSCMSIQAEALNMIDADNTSPSEGIARLLDAGWKDTTKIHFGD